MNRARPYVCNYAVLRFLPYPETDEFVNLGVVVHCAEARFLGVKVEVQRRRRVTDFFPELNRKAFAESRAAIVAELERVRELVTHETDRELGRRVFRELVRPRETVFRFGEIRTVLAQDLEAVTERLFEHYVDRRFAQPAEYHERVMADRFWNALRQIPSLQVFRRERNVGTEKYRVRMPIVSETPGRNGSPQRAIKPLDLNREHPTAIIDHGDAWTQRLRRLREVDSLPERMIVAVALPEDGAFLEAARQIQRDLTEVGAKVVGAADEKAILALATES